MNIKREKSILFALLAATLYAISTPVSKILLGEIQPVMLAALLYLGAGTGMFLLGLLRKKRHKVEQEAGLSREDLPFVTGMIVLDIAAPVFLMTGLSMTTAENASLLNNFEIVATTLIALIVFKEHVSKKLWIAVGLITFASIVLAVGNSMGTSTGNSGGLPFSFGSALILLACCCWGLENNCTRMLSIKDPLEIVTIKGFGSGTGSLLIALLLHQWTANLFYIAAALLAGFIAYGLSIYFYVYAQRSLGAAKTSAYYAVSPFIGVMLSFLIFRENPGVSFFIALLIMTVGTGLVIHDRHNHFHTHLPVAHNHIHSHDDDHHHHMHPDGEAAPGLHSHEHTHEKTSHSHEHNEDIHHIHTHPDSRKNQ